MSKYNLLAIDVGNTNITAAIFHGHRLAVKAKLPTHNYSKYAGGLRRLFRSYGLYPKDVEKCVISSVVPEALVRLTKLLNKFINARIIIMGKNENVPIKNLYKNKKEVGQDRLVNAFAAKVIYGVPCIIIDFGTAITFDIVSKRGEYLGGLILPGIEMSLNGLYEKTALLPKVTLKATGNIIGKDTVNSMRGGILFGFGTMCDGLISKYKDILGGGTKVILTGGNAGLIKKYSKSIQILDEDLTLKGLNLISLKR